MKTKEIEGLACFTVTLNIARSPLGKDLGCLILESDPDPDYYAKQHFPPNKHLSDWHLFLPMHNRVNCFQDLIIREKNRLHKKYNFDLHIAPGQMDFKDSQVQCIRINTKDTAHLPLLIEDLKNLGLQFEKDKNIQAFNSLVYFKKYLELHEIESGVYQDKGIENRYLFRAPGLLNYETLKKGMEVIKNNCDFHLFDYFLVSIFNKDDNVDYIGIYSRHCDKSRFRELKMEIKKLFNS